MCTTIALFSATMTTLLTCSLCQSRVKNGDGLLVFMSQVVLLTSLFNASCFLSDSWWPLMYDKNFYSLCPMLMSIYILQSQISLLSVFHAFYFQALIWQPLTIAQESISISSLSCPLIGLLPILHKVNEQWNACSSTYWEDCHSPLSFFFF